jgi:beta-galactosidase
MKKYLLLITLFLSCLFTMQLQAQDNAAKFFPAKDLMPIGAYYYPEHWEPSQWERDIKRMKDLGFEFTHYAEFAWGALEPEEGKYDFKWLDEAVEIAHKHGLKVIMCTPTPCPPAWLTQKHPEILNTDEGGITRKHGERLFANGAHPVYQKYIDKIITEMAKRYGNHPAVIGWQIDNEPHFATLYDYSDYSKTAFRLWLKEKYKNDIKALNKAWGTAFWSQQYNNFDQIEIPNKKNGASAGSPHSFLDFKRFNADQLALSLRFQSQILRKNISSKQYVTSNFAYYKFLKSVDLFRNKNDLDFASHTMYLLSTYLNYPKGELAQRLGSGMELSFSSEMARSITGYTGIMELQPGQINWGAWNAQPLPGAVRMWIWHQFALGERFVCTYRFRQPLYGSELYHNGIMETDGVTVARGGKEFVQANNEIKALRAKYNPAIKEPAEVAGRRTAFLWKHDNIWDIEEQPHTAQWDAYQHIYNYYENLKTLGAPVTFIQETDEFDVKKYPFMVAQQYQLIDKALVAKWKKYVEDGGNLILSSRTGQKDNNGQLWESLLQEPIYDLIGAKILYVDQLQQGTKANISFNGKLYDWTIWADVLENKNAEVLATHADQFYKGAPAVTTRKLGKGTVTYIGAWSNSHDLEREVLRTVYTRAGAKILDLPRYAFTEWRDGFWVTVNYTSENIEAPLSANHVILYGTKTVPPGQICVWQDK